MLTMFNCQLGTVSNKNDADKGHFLLNFSDFQYNLSRWVHLLCALYTPDVAFVKPEQLQCVTLSEVPTYKWGAKVMPAI